jgi:hypothetical protein
MSLHVMNRKRDLNDSKMLLSAVVFVRLSLKLSKYAKSYILDSIDELLQISSSNRANISDKEIYPTVEYHSTPYFGYE